MTIDKELMTKPIIVRRQNAQACPVCNGSGQYKEYQDYSNTNASPIIRTCHGCSGLGWVCC